MFIEQIEVDGYENVYNFRDDGFFAYIAVHSTLLGPALGGCRIRQYDSNEDALADALKLSKGMTHKCAAAGLNFGGAKCVVNTWVSSREIMLKVGEAVETLGGSYITGEDIGTTIDDMKIISEKTKHVTLIDPSPWTAIGVFECIQSVRIFSYQGGTSLNVWVQGLGKVGWELARLLHEDGYGLYVSDLMADRVEAAKVAFSAQEYTDDMAGDIDIYAPCALGGIVNVDNVNHIRFPIICGSANNQLADESLEDDGLAQRLHERGILYCPDWLVNAGGVIAAAAAETGFDETKVNEDVRVRGEVLLKAIAISQGEDKAPLWGAMAAAGLRLV